MADERQERGQDAGGPVVGPSYVMWEASLEKLKMLNYEVGYCLAKEYLFGEITNDPNFFKRDQYDDPNTVSNKLMLALRQIDFRLSFPAQKLRQACGENVCSVLEFLTDKALEAKKVTFKAPIYIDDDQVEHAVANDDDEEPDDLIQDDIEEDEAFMEDVVTEQHATSVDLNESLLDGSSRQILHGQIDPIEWKTELERVGQKLKTAQIVSTNEWRAHVDQTISSKDNIDKILVDTKGDLNALNHDVTDELSRMKTKERYINTQFSLLSNEYKEVKSKLEELEASSNKTNENVAKYTNELAEITEKLEDLKESFDSKDSGMHDTSPLVRIKTALQHLKAEISSHDLRIGVVAHSLLAARVAAANRKRIGMAKSAKRRSNKNRKSLSGHKGDDNDSLQSDDGDY